MSSINTRIVGKIKIKVFKEVIKISGHNYTKEELVELKRKYDMQVSKEAIEEIKHNIDLDKKCDELQNRIDRAIEYIEENSDDMHTYISQVLTSILKGSDRE